MTRQTTAAGHSGLSWGLSAKRQNYSAGFAPPFPGRFDFSTAPYEIGYTTGIYAGQPARSNWMKTTDPPGTEHFEVFDNLGRRIRVIHNYQDGTPDAVTESGRIIQRDMTSAWEYDGVYRVVKAMAHELADNPEGADTETVRVTEYGYGLTILYDGLRRLVELDPEGATGTKRWNLTALGNWREVKLDGLAVDTRSHNERDGLGRIIAETVSGEHTYYSAGWQVLSVFAGEGSVEREYICGPRYVDELTSMQRYIGGPPTRQYKLQDANWNVVMTLDGACNDQEYIRMRILWKTHLA